MERSSKQTFRVLAIDSDLDLLAELIPKGFPDLHEGRFPLRDWLRWKYSISANPLGSTIGFVSDIPSSFYGILVHRYTFGQALLQVGLVVDVMTVPEARGKGLFVETARAALDGLRDKSVAFTIGFPIRKDVMPGHLRLAWKPTFPVFVYFTPIGRASKKSPISLGLRALRLLLPRTAFPHPKTTHTSDLNIFLDSTRALRGKNAGVTADVAQLEKSDEFLRWRLAQPGVNYEFVVFRDGTKFAYAVCRVASLSGTRSLAVVDIDGSDPSSVGSVVRALADIAVTKHADLLVVSTNPSNAKRLGFLRSGLFKSPLKFTTILRDVPNSNLEVAGISESQWRITWLDSDTL